MPNINYLLASREAIQGFKRVDVVSALIRGNTASETAQALGCTRNSVFHALEEFVASIASVSRWGRFEEVLAILHMPSREVLARHQALLQVSLDCYVRELHTGSMTLWETPPQAAVLVDSGLVVQTAPEVVWTPKMDALLGTMADIDVASALNLRYRDVYQRRHALGVRAFRRHKTRDLVQKIEGFANRNLTSDTWAFASSPFAAVPSGGSDV
jgi:hypothetical protein